MGTGSAGNTRCIGSLFVEKGRVSAFLEDSKSWGATPLEQKPAKNDDGMLR
jgi:hypothetical protein